MSNNYWIKQNKILYPGVIHGNVLNASKIIVLFSGLGFSMCDRDYLMTRLAHRLIKSNILVFQFDIRGHGDSEVDFSQITLNTIVEDIKNITEYLSNEFNKEIIFIGRGICVSACYLALSLLKNKLVKKIIAFNPFFLDHYVVSKLVEPIMYKKEILIEELLRLDNAEYLLYSLGAEPQYINAEFLNSRFISQLVDFDVLKYYNKYKGEKIIIYTGFDKDYTPVILKNQECADYLELDRRSDSMLPFNSLWQSNLLNLIVSCV